MSNRPSGHPWTEADIPDLRGRRAVVTGATGGLGFEVARALAARGADTVLAARSSDKGARAMAAILAGHPGARLRFDLLDLASLDSVKAFADRWTGQLDILVNNGAVMGLPTRQVTRDGFEQQFGVNYLAHFALTARLRSALTAADQGGRVVNVASLAHRSGALRLDDLQSQTAYGPMIAYRQSKLAMLMFSLELDRRARAGGWRLQAIAAHPGWSRTSIIPNGMGAGAPGLKARIAEVAFGLMAQSAKAGALPILFAATADQASPGGYYGPDRFGETRGAPSASRIFPQAQDTRAAAALWAESERLTGVVFG